ncbi:MAG TPA: response regulator [Bacteroidales bacterium]|jgi:two-component system KDP operon response regulator KdpE|nr:response regulator [Bacteroidales bacterium]MDI9533769.1 response regulator [Bacteroidota bacterium]MBP7037123.1 response regulator [Bacteroidales bacterium]MBP8708995.1 response regulator [Bacteroidales bacterium]MDX9928038.1 response regulator [Bacteroidales bacterium]
MNDNRTILIIDDEVQIRRLLEISLSTYGFNTVFATTGKEGLVAAATHSPALVILDLGLPDMDGMKLLETLREWYTKPVIILSVRNSEDDIIKALDRGANDYLTKPFRGGELVARIRAAIRLSEEKKDTPLMEFGSLTIDMLNHVVRKSGEIIKLTSTEYSLLTLLAKNTGRVLTHRFILKEIWGYGYLEQTQYLRVFIAQLRKKIEENPSNPVLLITESGIGYRFGS